MNQPVHRKRGPGGVTTPASFSADAARLARAFVHVLRLRLTREQLTEIRIRNDEERDPDACHTFDFCDPQDAMAVAAMSIGIAPSSRVYSAADAPGSPEAAAYELAKRLEHAAWTIAKQTRFVEELIQ